MDKFFVVGFLLFSLISVTFAGNFLNNLNIFGSPPMDVDISVREIPDPQCQWFNSGLLGFQMDRKNTTTTCRCRAVNMKECRTVIPVKNSARPTKAAPTSGMSTPAATTTQP